MRITEGLAYRIMRLKTRFPSPDSLSCAEIFETEAFRNGSLEYRQELMRKSSQWRCECEVQADSLAARLPCGPERYLRDRVVLDLGCFTGGRSARWAEVHGIRELHGLDVDDVFVSAAQAFARARNLNAHYVKGFGESLPYEDVKFDTIVSLDVLEHVRDYGAVLAECWRTLKPGGHFIAVFPPYYSPCDHHLSQASAVPCLTWLFSGRTLTRAYNRILDERGPAARWYSRRSRELAAWEKSHVLNGITLGGFRRALRRNPWAVELREHVPLFDRRAGLWMPVRWVFRALANLPVVCELFTTRGTYVLRKA